jgi:uncharacterized protein YkwD
MKKTFVKLTLATAAAIALTACGGDDSGEGNGVFDGYNTPQPFPAPPISGSTKNEYLDAISAARAEGRYCGERWYDAAPPATWSEKLYTAAYEHSQDMSATGYYSHDGSGTETDWTARVHNLENGSSVSDRLYNAGTLSGSTGENILVGAHDATNAVQMWLDSPSHCESLMYPGEVSVGMANVNGYWTLDFSFSI